MIKNDTQQKQATAHREKTQDHDVEFTLRQTVGQKIPPGPYEVQFIKVEKQRLWVPKIKLWFRVISFDEYQGIELFMACPIPENGKSWGCGSKYIRAWALAAGKLPDRFDRISTKAFRGKIFLVQVRTVDTDSKQQKIPEAAQYSVIDYLISLVQ